MTAVRYDTPRPSKKNYRASILATLPTPLPRRSEQGHHRPTLQRLCQLRDTVLAPYATHPPYPEYGTFSMLQLRLQPQDTAPQWTPPTALETASAHDLIDTRPVYIKRLAMRLCGLSQVVRVRMYVGSCQSQCAIAKV